MDLVRNTPGRLFVILSGVTAVVLVACLFLLEGHLGFSLWDEGFLWYGVQRVMLGELPLRDFQSYDPGRYYLSAALMFLMRENGIIALRLTHTCCSRPLRTVSTSGSSGTRYSSG